MSVKILSQDIKKDECFMDFIESRDVGESTKRSYLHRITRYCDFIGRMPTELIEEAEEEQDQGIKTRKRKIKRYLIDYKYHLENQGSTPTAIKNHISTVRSFYRSFDIDVPTIKFRKQNTNVSLEETIPIGTIKKIINIANLRDKAIVLLMLSSGMGAAEIKALDYGTFLKGILDYIDLKKPDYFNIDYINDKLEGRNDIIGTWKIKRIKTGKPYYTFNSPESTNAILEYLAERNRQNIPPKKMEDPLFISDQRKRLSDMAFLYIFHRLNDNLGLGFRTRNRRVFTSHQLRKLFTTTLYSNGADKLFVDWLLGHSIHSTTESYFKTNVKDLKNQYMKFVKHLMTEKADVRRISSDEVKEIVNELNEKDKQMKQMKKEQKIRDEKVNAKIEKMEAIIEAMMEKQMENENKS